MPKITESLKNQLLKLQYVSNPELRSFTDLCGEWADTEGTVILRSPSGWSVLAADPYLILDCKRDLLQIRGDGTPVFRAVTDDPLRVLDELIRMMPTDPTPKGCPGPGLYGYFGYDLSLGVRRLRTAVQASDLPDLFLVIPKRIWIWNSETNEHRALSLPEDLLSLPNPPAGSKEYGITTPMSSPWTKSEYIEAVSYLKEAIRSGDIYQINLSQRFSAGFRGNSFSLFEDLFETNPADRFAYIHGGSHRIVSSSPEVFLSLKDHRITTRPIKGTAPRGASESEDQILRRQLADSPKENAELSMIVDLMRNDLSRICRSGSVKVDSHRKIEKYANVYHTVSTISGRLDPGRTPGEILRATFPPGSVTGCPKNRAMEYIDFLEPESRGLYTGAVGWIGREGDLELSVAIRTAVIADHRLSLSVGGGIVIDSDPLTEYEETLHKGASFFSVLNPPPAPPSPELWFNGKFIRRDGALIFADHPAIRTGWGLFETFLKTPRGILQWNSHFRRFRNSWQKLIPSRFPEIDWLLIVQILIDRNQLQNQDAIIRLQGLYNPERESSFDLLISVTPYTRPAPLKHAVIYPEGRTSPMADHKTISRVLHSVADRPDSEVMLLNGDGTISELLRASLILIKGLRAVLPESPHVLPGTTQEFCVENLKKRGFTVCTAFVRPEEITPEWGILACSSAAGIRALETLETTPLKNLDALAAEMQNEYLNLAEPLTTQRDFQPRFSEDL